MKSHNHFILFLSFVIILSLPITTKAQVVVDGNLNEWGDSKNMQYDNENNLYYAFKKDNQFLYMTLFKNKYPFKFHGGGVQIFFGEKKADTTGLQLFFAYNFKDPVTQKYQKYSRDFFTVKNLNNIKEQKLATYNETGILLEWNITDIEYLVINNHIIDQKATPPNPNIFTAEIQIPLEYLQKYCLNQTLNFGIALRGPTYKLPSFGVSQLIQRFQNQANDYQKEQLDQFTPTSFFGSVNLNTL